MRPFVRRLLLLLLVTLAGCATRSSHTTVATAPGTLDDGTATRLVSVWQEKLCQYVEREGNGDVAVLDELRGLRSRDVLRPGRITFGALEVEADSMGRDGWDVQGVLVGAQPGGGGDTRYVFVVGITGRSGFLPGKLQDIRLVGLVPQSGRLNWERGDANPAALKRYRETFSDPRRFPADDDSFSMKADGTGVLVQESRSGADWFLPVSAAKPASGNPLVIPVIKARPPSEKRCGSA